MHACKGLSRSLCDALFGRADICTHARAQGAFAYLCDLFLLSLPSAGQFLPAAATVVSLWPSLLAAPARQPSLPGTLVVVLHDLCITSPSFFVAARALDSGAGDDTVTAGSWSGTTAGWAAKAQKLAQASQQEIRRLGELHWGWTPEVQGCEPKQQLPAHCRQLLTHVTELAQAGRAATAGAWASLRTALVIASLRNGWRWALDEVCWLISGVLQLAPEYQPLACLLAGGVLPSPQRDSVTSHELYGGFDVCAAFFV